MSLIMDELQRSIYVDRFRLAFHPQQGTAFQDWFVRLAGHAFGADFEEVRPYGVKLIAKVDQDFHGARSHWAAEMAEWFAR
jgi:hypothetical protein